MRAQKATNSYILDAGINIIYNFVQNERKAIVNNNCYVIDLKIKLN